MNPLGSDGSPGTLLCWFFHPVHSLASSRINLLHGGRCEQLVPTSDFFLSFDRAWLSYQETISLCMWLFTFLFFSSSLLGIPERIKEC